MDPIFADERWTAYGLFHEAARAVAAALEAEAPDELDAEVGSVLLQLARTPEERLRMVDLARAMSLHPSKATRLVDRCERLGLVERIPCETDRRSLWASLTDAGRAAITDAAPTLLDALDRHYFSLLSEREQAQIAKLARRLRDAVYASGQPCTD